MTERRPRRTAAEVSREIRRAVIELIHDGGYAAVNFEAVARRAEASKPVLYRRFSSRAHMTLDAIQHERPSVSEPGTAPLCECVRAMLRRTRTRYADFGQDVYRGIIGEADDQVDAQIRAFTDDFARAIQDALRAAAARGEPVRSSVPSMVAETPLLVLRDHLLFGGATDEIIDDIVDRVFLPLVQIASAAAPAASGDDRTVRPGS